MSLPLDIVALLFAAAVIGVPVLACVWAVRQLQEPRA